MFADGVIEGSATTGTNDYVLTGAAFNGRTFGQDFVSGGQAIYWAQTRDRSKWEMISGVYNVSGSIRTLTRATVLKSSNAGAKIDWQPIDEKYIYSITSADALAGLLKGSLASGTRPWWVRSGGRWWDYAADVAVSWIDKLATGASTDIRVGIYDVVKNTYFADGRRPRTATGTAGKTVAATDIGGVFSFDNSAANRTMTLPAHGAAGVGHGFRVGGLGLTKGGQFGIVLTPAANDGIEGGADAATLTIPGGVRFDVVWDEPSDTWRVEYLTTVPPVLSGRRQTVAAGPVSSAGLPSGLPSTNGALSITWTIGATTRFVATAANGWDWQGRPSDRVGVSLVDLQWTGLTPSRPATAPNFIYTAIAAGVLTPGSTVLAPIYQWGGTPDTTNGQFTFNRSEMKGYLGNGTTAPEAFIVFVGEAATDGSGVISTVAYAYNGRYDSGFTATLPAASVEVSKNHNLGVKPGLAKFVVECTTAEYGYAIGDQITEGHITATGPSYISLNLYSTTKTVALTMGSNEGYWVQQRTGSPGDTAAATEASWKYKFVVDRGW